MLPPGRLRCGPCRREPQSDARRDRVLLLAKPIRQVFEIDASTARVRQTERRSGRALAVRLGTPPRPFARRTRWPMADWLAQSRRTVADVLQRLIVLYTRIGAVLHEGAEVVSGQRS